MSIFPLLFVGHLAGDFLLQNRWMAENKNKKNAPLIVHSAVYTMAVATFSLAGGGLKWYCIVLAFLSHVFLDQRNFVLFWAKTVTRATDVPWLLIMLDQTWHLLVLLVIAGLNGVA
jgi:hypothetical protein